MGDGERDDVALAAQLMKGSLWLGLSRVLVNGLGAISTVVLAHLLAPAGFGIFALALAITVILAAVTDISMTQALIQRQAIDEGHVHSAFTLNVLRGLAVAAFIAAGAYPLALFMEEPRLTAVLLVLAGGFVVNSLANPRLALLQRQLVFRQELMFAVAQKLATVAVTIIIAALLRTYWALVIGVVVGQAVGVLVSYAIAPFRPRFTLSHGRDLFAFSGWLTAGEVVETLNWRMDLLFIGKFLDVTSTGLYSVGSNLAMLPTREAIEPLTRTLFPGLARVTGDRERLIAGYQRAQALVTSISLPAGIGTALLAEPLVRLFMGERWLGIVFVLQPLSVTFAAQTIGTQVRPLALAMGETRQLFWRNVQLLCARLPIVIAGLLIDGLRGMVIARVLAGLIGIVINMAQVRRLLGLSLARQIGSNARAIGAVVAMAAVVLIVGAAMPRESDTGALIARIVVPGMLGALTYGGGSLLLWTMMGRPIGPESEIVAAWRKLASRRMSRRLQAKVE